MRKALFVMAALVLATAAFADVVGTYAGEGANPGGGGSYTCEVQITKAGDVYGVKWFFEGQLGYEGVGIMKNGLFCVGYASSNSYGVVVYEVATDGTLKGVWATPGFDDLGTETLKKE